MKKWDIDSIAEKDANTVNMKMLKKIVSLKNCPSSLKGLEFMFIAILLITGCDDKRHPNKIYMPDMAYSRALEAYAPNNLESEGINYIPSPVAGTIRRGDLFPYTLPNDSSGYKMSAAVKDPLPPLDSASLYEAQRLFNVNCAICHGINLDAQGPLAASGKIGGVANFKLDQYLKLPIGTMFHVATYGKGVMGSYASQLSRKQRWMVVEYIKAQQAKEITSKTDSTGNGGGAGKADSTVNGSAGKNSTAKK